MLRTLTDRKEIAKWGDMAGITSMLSITTVIPILIYINPDFSTSLSGFDPLSQLSNTPATKVYYRILLIVTGILTMLYFEMSFIPSREEYEKLQNWKLIKIFIRIGVIGQISTGIFDEGIFPQHLFATILFATGYVGGLGLFCFNMANQMKNTGKYWILLNAGFVTSIIALMNAIYFRYSTIRGIWQFFIMLSTMCWYLAENFYYRKYKPLLQQEIIKEGIVGYTKYTYLMFAVGIYLILFGFMLYYFPTWKPWACAPHDRKCDIPNVVSLLIAGTILLSFITIYMKRATIYKSTSETASA